MDKEFISRKELDDNDLIEYIGVSLTKEDIINMLKRIKEEKDDTDWTNIPDFDVMDVFDGIQYGEKMGRRQLAHDILADMGLCMDERMM